MKNKTITKDTITLSSKPITLTLIGTFRPCSIDGYVGFIFNNSKQQTIIRFQDIDSIVECDDKILTK